MSSDHQCAGCQGGHTGSWDVLFLPQNTSRKLSRLPYFFLPGSLFCGPSDHTRSCNLLSVVETFPNLGLGMWKRRGRHKMKQAEGWEGGFWHHWLFRISQSAAHHPSGDMGPGPVNVGLNSFSLRPPLVSSWGPDHVPDRFPYPLFQSSMVFVRP